MAPKEEPASKHDLLAKATEFREMAKTALSTATRDILLKLAAEYETETAKREI
jgi:hypothetical protein